MEVVVNDCKRSSGFLILVCPCFSLTKIMHSHTNYYTRHLLNHKIIGLRIEFAHEDNKSWNKLDWLAMKCKPPEITRSSRLCLQSLLWRGTKVYSQTGGGHDQISSGSATEDRLSRD